MIDDNLDSFSKVNDGGSERFHEPEESLGGDFVADLVHPDAVVDLERLWIEWLDL